MLLPPTVIDWLTFMESKSKVYEEFGSFMEPQKELLRILYQYLHSLPKRVATFSAPPASGKTHVISLVAHYLFNERVKSCIVVPNDELKSDFVEQNTKVKFPRHPNVLSLAEYLKDNSQYDIAMVDEAHNLRSAYELNPNIVKTFLLDRNDPYFNDISYRYLNDKKFVASTLSIEACSDILKILIKNPRFKASAIRIKKELSSWIGFIIANESECKIKLLYADPSKRSLTPRNALILFSATPLDNKELEFYCNIPVDDIQPFPVESAISAKGKITYFALNKTIRFEDKIEIAINALRRAERKSLILLNNTEGCDKWFSYLNHVISNDRVSNIRSGLNGDQRRSIFEKFKSTKDGILLSSSSVFWEGITIRDLQLLIIPDSPYPEPHLLDIYNNKKFTHATTVKRRLIQGLGRIGRNPKDRAVGLMLFRPNIADNAVILDRQKLSEKVMLALKETAL